MRVIKCGVVLLLVFVSIVNAEAAAKASSKFAPPPAYYQRLQPVTAQLLFPECIDPEDAVLKEQCSLIASRIDFLEGKLKNLCSNAGETILHTVDNVQGVYVHSPQNIGNGYFHEDEGTWELFVSPTFGPRYKFWEIDKSWQGNKIQNCRYELKLSNRGRSETVTACKGLAEPESTYGITWAQLTSADEQRQVPIFGDELTVLNLATNETLATRRFYFYVIRDNQISLGSGRNIPTPGIRNTFRTFIRACPSYSPKEDDGYRDMRPRHSSEFITRVLKPASN